MVLADDELAPTLVDLLLTVEAAEGPFAGPRARGGAPGSAGGGTPGSLGGKNWLGRRIGTRHVGDIVDSQVDLVPQALFVVQVREVFVRRDRGDDVLDGGVHFFAGHDGGERVGC